MILNWRRDMRTMVGYNPVAGSLIFPEIREIIQCFLEILQKLWSEWELRGMVLLSLCLQIVLLILGRRRKCIGTKFGFVIDSIVWVAYSSADQIATVSLGIISCSLANSSSNNSEKNAAAIITAFWAPFLLLHLGGQDSITAYSSVDNDGYSRQLLVFIFQVGVTFVIIFRSWSNTLLGFPISLIFISGILKIRERIWSLWSSSSYHLRNSLLPPPFPGTDYPESIRNFRAGKNNGLEMEFRFKKEELANKTIDGTQKAQTFLQEPIDLKTEGEVELLTDAYLLFDIFRRLYANLFISYVDRGRGWSMLTKYRSRRQVFKVIEMEIGIMYDTLYTKASTAHSVVGLHLRIISLLCSTVALGLFSNAIGSSEHDFSAIDVGITYLLLIMAVLIEICSDVMLIFSEPSLRWLSRWDKKLGASMYRAISSPPLTLIIGKRWSGNMGQYNLIDLCLQDKPADYCQKVLKFFQINEKLEMSWQEVTDDLKEQIIERIANKWDNAGPVYKDPKQPLKEAICSVLDQNIDRAHQPRLFTSEEFDRNVLLWHIATDICYCSNSPSSSNYSNSPSSSNNPSPHFVGKISKSLSDYMLYLLVMCPTLLPKGIGEIRYRDTCEEAKRYFQQRTNRIQRDKSRACSLLLGEDTEILPCLAKGDKSKSVLFEGVILAQGLQKLGGAMKWHVMTQVWIEMLCHAAIQSEWKYHGQQLSKGGEFLTHVCLLLAHLGVTVQYKVLQGERELAPKTPGKQAAHVK